MTFEALDNPVTGEYGVLRQPALDPDSVTVADLYAHPGAAVAYEHIHPGMTETFTVVRGHLTLKKDGHQSEAGARSDGDCSAGHPPRLVERRRRNRLGRRPNLTRAHASNP